VSRSRARWLALDVVCVVVFVAIGRRSHDEGLGGTVKVAAPFVIGLALGWALSCTRHAWQRQADLASGVVIWLSTVVAGLVLRRTVFGRGTATAFVIVATVTLCLFLLGWRLIAAARGRRRGDPARASAQGSNARAGSFAKDRLG
jgi:hypothetical protein